MENPGAAELRFINATVGPSIPTSRIEIVVRGEALTLTEHYTSNIDATHWLPKIRRFLRDHGWRPSHEREDEQVAERHVRKKSARRAKR